jgi:hypothetical protein
LAVQRSGRGCAIVIVVDGTPGFLDSGLELTTAD